MTLPNEFERSRKWQSAMLWWLIRKPVRAYNARVRSFIRKTVLHHDLTTQDEESLGMTECIEKECT